jgi:hypothetical protein
VKEKEDGEEMGEKGDSPIYIRGAAGERGNPRLVYVQHRLSTCKTISKALILPYLIYLYSLFLLYFNLISSIYSIIISFYNL